MAGKRKKNLATVKDGTVEDVLPDDTELASPPIEDEDVGVLPDVESGDALEAADDEDDAPDARQALDRSRRIGAHVPPNVTLLADHTLHRTDLGGYVDARFPVLSRPEIEKFLERVHFNGLKGNRMHPRYVQDVQVLARGWLIIERSTQRTYGVRDFGVTGGYVAGPNA